MFYLIWPKVVDRGGGGVRSNVAVGWFFPCIATDKWEILTFSLQKNQWLYFDSSSIQLTQLWLKWWSAWFDSDSTHILDFHGRLDSFESESSQIRLTTHESGTTLCLTLCDVFSPVWPCVTFSVPIWPCVTSSLLIWPWKTLSDPEVTSSHFVWPCATFSVPIWPCVTCHFWADRVWPCQFLSDLVWPRHFWSDLVWPFQSLSDLVWPPQSLLDLL